METKTKNQNFDIMVETISDVSKSIVSETVIIKNKCREAYSANSEVRIPSTELQELIFQLQLIQPVKCKSHDK